MLATHLQLAHEVGEWKCTPPSPNMPAWGGQEQLPFVVDFEDFMKILGVVPQIRHILRCVQTDRHEIPSNYCVRAVHFVRTSSYRRLSSCEISCGNHCS
jgi:hypothetical protein